MSQHGPEPDAVAMDLSTACVLSIAISLKRIADVLEGRRSSGVPGEPGFDSGQLGLVDALVEAWRR